MMKSLAVELARSGIRAHSIVPGWIDTNMTEKTLASDGFPEQGFALGCRCAAGARATILVGSQFI